MRRCSADPLVCPVAGQTVESFCELLRLRAVVRNEQVYIKAKGIQLSPVGRTGEQMVPQHFQRDDLFKVMNWYGVWRIDQQRLCSLVSYKPNISSNSGTYLLSRNQDLADALRPAFSITHTRRRSQ